ncbi:MAG TPA: imelysin family protein [Cyclobacteriaceae bacterium]
MKYIYILCIILTVVTVQSCKDDGNEVPAIDTTLNSKILANFSVSVASALYMDLQVKTAQLNTQFASFKSNPSEVNLKIMQSSWKDTHTVWEQTEAHLFGPVVTKNIYSRLDTWPVNPDNLDAQLSSNNAFTDSYIDGLSNELKGFHAIEYLLFGKEGAKRASDFIPQQTAYLEGLILNVNKLTLELKNEWDPSNASTNYISIISNAGNGSGVYTSQRAVFEELVKSMAALCEEAANKKLKQPFEQKNPALEESRFAFNSIADINNNLKGIINVYQGRYKTDGEGLENLVRGHNGALDDNIKAKMTAAILALESISAPLGTAINTQPAQVQNAIDTITQLKTVLEDDLTTFLQQHSN